MGELTIHGACDVAVGSYHTFFWGTLVWGGESISIKLGTLKERYRIILPVVPDVAAV